MFLRLHKSFVTLTWKIKGFLEQQIQEFTISKYQRSLTLTLFSIYMLVTLTRGNKRHFRNFHVKWNKFR